MKIPTINEGKNVEKRLRLWLLSGKTITHNQAQVLWGTNRLAVFISRCRKAGMKIRTDMVYEKDDSYGVYSLIKKKKVSRIEDQSYRLKH